MKISDLQQYGIGSVNGAVPFADGGFVKVSDVENLVMDARDPADVARLIAIEKEVLRWTNEGGPNAALEAIKKILGVKP